VDRDSTISGGVFIVEPRPTLRACGDLDSPPFGFTNAHELAVRVKPSTVDDFRNLLGLEVPKQLMPRGVLVTVHQADVAVLVRTTD